MPSKDVRIWLGAVEENATEWWVDFRWMYQIHVNYFLDVLDQT